MDISITPRNTGQYRAIQDRCALMRVDTLRFVLRFVHSCILPRPSTQTRWVAQAGTLSSPHRLAILNPQTYTYTHPHDARRPPNESHTWGPRRKLALVHYLRTSADHMMRLSSHITSFSLPQHSPFPSGISRLKYTSRSCQTSVTLATSIIKPPRWSSQVYRPAPPSFFHLHFH